MTNSSDKMSQEEMDKLTGHAIRDSDFRTALLQDPSGALSANGYTVDDDVVSSINKASNDDVEGASGGFADVTGVSSDDSADPG